MRKLHRLRPPRVQLQYDIEPTSLNITETDENLARLKLLSFVESSIQSLPVFGALSSTVKTVLPLSTIDLLYYLCDLSIYKQFFKKITNKVEIAKHKELVALENLLLLITLRAFRQAIVVPINNTFNKILSIYLPIIFIVIRIFSIQKNLSISA